MAGSIVENFLRVNAGSSKSFDAHYFRRSATLPAMAYDPVQRRRALKSFLDSNGLKPKALARDAGLSETALWPFMNGKTRALGDDTYEALAGAATQQLQREIRSGQLRGEPPMIVQIEIAHKVGAGDEIHLIPGAEGIDWIDAPPGFEQGVAAMVSGDSMRPTFDDGDILFYRHQEPPPLRNLPARAVIVQVRDGPLYVKKLLPGTRKGRFHLISINPLTAPLLDQPVESFARIGWVKPAQ